MLGYVLSSCSTTFLLLLSLAQTFSVNARIVVDMTSLQDYDKYDYDEEGNHEYPSSYKYEISLQSVAYFDREFIDPNLVRIVLESEARLFSMDYVLENYEHSSINDNNQNATTTISIDDDDDDNNNKSNTTGSNSTIIQNFYDDKDISDNNNNSSSIDKACNWWQGIMLADLSKYTIENITFVADLWYTDFVILIADEDNFSWRETFDFWWSHKLPNISPEYYNMMDKNITPPFFLAVSRVTGNCTLTDSFA